MIDVPYGGCSIRREARYLTWCYFWGLDPAESSVISISKAFLLLLILSVNLKPIKYLKFKNLFTV